MRPVVKITEGTYNQINLYAASAGQSSGGCAAQSMIRRQPDNREFRLRGQETERL